MNENSQMKLIYNLILNKTRGLHLPWRVTSTAFQVNERLKEYFLSNSKIQSLKNFEKVDFISTTCLFLGCKFEDIHGMLDKMLEKIPNTNISMILENEVGILEYLEFNFVYNDIYQQALGYKLILDELTKSNDKPYNIQWVSIMESLDRGFCIVDAEKYTIKEKITAALWIDEFQFNTIKKISNLGEVDLGNVKKIREGIKENKLYNNQQIQEILEKE